MHNKGTSIDIETIVSKGDISAFTDLYNLYFSKLFLESVKYVKDAAIAEEIIQDVFLRIWEKGDRINQINSAKSYLYRAVINASINYIKRQKNIENHHQKLYDDFSENSLQELDEEKELIIRLYQEIDNLPAKCKEVFILSRFDGLKYKEIALKLNISERTVENHIANGLKILKEKMVSGGYHSNKMFNLLFSPFF